MTNRFRPQDSHDGGKEGKKDQEKEEHRVQDNSQLHLFKMKRSTTKWWEHIMLIAPTGENKKWESKDAIGAWCLKCKEKIHFKLKDVNAVKRHIVKKHPNLLEPENSEERSKKRYKTNSLQDCFVSVQKRDLKPSTTADQKMGEALLVHWTSTSLRPFTIIEDKGFLGFAHWLNSPRTYFKVPSRNKL